MTSQRFIFQLVIILGSFWAQATFAVSCPTSYVPSGQATNTTYSCTCGAVSTGGAVWGSGIYCDGSNMCTAALHAGVIPASGGTVTYTLKGAQNNFSSSTQNGVTTQSYGYWGQSYSFPAAAPATSTPGAPSINSVSVSGTSLVVSLGAPSAGSSAISQYEVQAFLNGSSTAAKVVTGSSTSITVTSLANGSYTVKARAKNASGFGPLSNASSSYTMVHHHQTTPTISI